MSHSIIYWYSKQRLNTCYLTGPTLSIEIWHSRVLDLDSRKVSEIIPRIFLWQWEAHCWRLLQRCNKERCTNRKLQLLECFKTSKTWPKEQDRKGSLLTLEGGTSMLLQGIAWCDTPNWESTWSAMPTHHFLRAMRSRACFQNECQGKATFKSILDHRL